MGIYKDKEAALRLPKNMMSSGKFNSMKALVDAEVVASKYRMSVRKMEEKEDEGEMGRRDGELNVDEIDEVEERRVEMDIGMSGKRVTDMKTCRRITVPGQMERLKEFEVANAYE